MQEDRLYTIFQQLYNIYLIYHLYVTLYLSTDLYQSYYQKKIILLPDKRVVERLAEGVKSLSIEEDAGNIYK